MRAFIGLLFAVSCGSIVLASQNEQKVQSENVKQEKRSLSHGIIGDGYSSKYGNIAGSYGSYGLAGAEGSIVSSGPVLISGGSGLIGSGYGGGPGLVGAGAGFGIGTAQTVGVSTNTDTLTTVHKTVPVPVDRPVPVYASRYIKAFEHKA